MQSGSEESLRFLWGVDSFRVMMPCDGGKNKYRASSLPLKSDRAHREYYIASDEKTLA
jgi:hypothetical protein